MNLYFKIKYSWILKHSCQPSRFLRDSPEFNSLSRLPDPASFCPGFEECPIKMNDSMFCSYFCSYNQKQRSVKLKPFDSQRFECGMIIGYLCVVINQQVPSWSGLKGQLTLFTFHFQHPAQFERPSRSRIRCAESTLCRANREESRLCNSLKVAWFTESPTYRVLKLQSGTLVLKIIHIYDPYNF